MQNLHYSLKRFIFAIIPLLYLFLHLDFHQLYPPSRKKVYRISTHAKTNISANANFNSLTHYFVFTYVLDYRGKNRGGGGILHTLANSASRSSFDEFFVRICV